MKRKTITARVDERIVHEIEFIKSSLNLESNTNVLLRAVHDLYDQVRKEQAKKSPFDLMEELEMVGCFEGPKDLSINYKKELGEYLEKKHFLKSKKTGLKSRRKSKS